MYFYPPAVYQKVSLVTKLDGEAFFSSFKVLKEEGYLKIARILFRGKGLQTVRKTEMERKTRLPVILCSWRRCRS